MTRMAFFLRYGRLEAVSVRTSFAKSLQMEVHCSYYVTEIANLQIFGHKAEYAISTCTTGNDDLMIHYSLVLTPPLLLPFICVH